MDGPDTQVTPLTRRRLLGTAAAAGTVLLLPRSAVAALNSGAHATDTAASGPARRGGTLQLGTPQPIQTLDPHAFGIYNNRNAWPGLYNGLTKYDVQLNPLPDLATSWEHTGDGKTWTFHLRRNVRFHSGEKMTARDVKYSIDRVLNPKTVAGVYAQGISEIQRVEVVDPSTVRIHLSQPSAILLAGLARVMIIPVGSGGSIATKAIGTGPFSLKSYSVNNQLVLQRFTNYWDSKSVYLDGVTIRTVPDPTALFTALLSGNVDVYWQLDPKYLAQMSGNKNVHPLRAHSSAVVKYMAIDNQSEPFVHLEARQALLHAMDLQTINQIVFSGTGTLTQSDNFLPKGHWALANGLTPYPYDLARAKALFAKYNVKNLSYVGLNIVPWTTGVGNVLQQSLAQIGINLDVTNAELNTWSAAYNPHPGPGVIVPNAALPDYDPAFIWNIADPKVNPWRFTSPQFGAMLAQGRRTLGIPARKKIYANVQKFWNQNVPVPVICHDAWIHAVNERVHNLLHLNSGDLDYRGTWVT